jgi:uncharacterized membrane protein YdbT with pleckstrin-like domain
MTPKVHETETTLWEASPSQWLNFGPFLVGGLFFWLVVPAVWAFWRYLQVRSTKYRMSTQRLSIKTGVFNIQAIDVEHYRIKDHTLDQPFFLRLAGLGNVEIVTSDATYHHLTLRAIRGPEALRDQLRASVEHIRDIKGVREIDWHPE